MENVYFYRLRTYWRHFNSVYLPEETDVRNIKKRSISLFSLFFIRLIVRTKRRCFITIDDRRFEITIQINRERTISAGHIVHEQRIITIKRRTIRRRLNSTPNALVGRFFSPDFIFALFACFRLSRYYRYYVSAVNIRTPKSKYKYGATNTSMAYTFR